ncbi:MAG: peptidase M22 [Ruminococcus bromii]|jgi:N6-L-threonylcarbamoyladenine synthase|nr:peptidase M22 [Ruminococcus bromii]HCB95445.1 peptidase M22 [Ruminococcus sp.]MDD6433186.1 peptidase M22 [Ruminococcus bromii]MDY4085131.1 peptidase M22 [Ruminococcus bromii]MEE0964275.1 peptidase M22 [Ruminococcus bromii]
MSFFLGIDTSNYTTSTAVFDSNTGKFFQQKKLLPVKPGELGLRQSDAVFHHTAQLHLLFSELVKDIDSKDIAAIGASSRPRPVDGSYMPCFTVGENTAKILSSALKVPLYTFSHQEGHIAAALYDSKSENLFTEKFLAFHVSGGTTEAVIAKGNGYGFSLDLAAKSLDLNAGQAIDRVGLMLGLRFPCGAELEKLALKNTKKISVRPTLKECDCCLSGLENICRRLLENNESKEYIAAYCIEYIRKTLSLMTDKLLLKYGTMPVLYAGGVMSDSIIQNSFKEKYNAAFAQPSLSSDNAVGIAYLAYRKYKNVHTEF